MTTSRPVRLVALAAIAGCTALSMQGVSAASTHHSSKKLPTPKTGLYAAGETRITSSTKPAAYAVDSNNHEHFLQFKAGATAATGKIVYRSRRLGAKKWVTHNAPGFFDTSGQPRLELLNDSQDINDLDAVAYPCGGVYAVAFSHGATRLPEFTKVSSVSDCAKTSPPQRMAASFNPGNITAGYLNVIVPDGTTPGQWDLVSGKPGSTFKQIGTVPSADSFVPSQFVGQTYYGGVAIGQGVDANGNEGVYATNLSFKYDSDIHSTVTSWTDPKQIATLGSPTKDYTITSAAFLNDRTDIGLYLPAGSRSGQKHTLFVDEQDSSGQWTSPISIPGTNLHDRYLIVSTNSVTTKLRATWQRVITSSAKAKRTKSGVLSSRRLSTGWTTPAFQSHWYKDRPLSTTYDSNANPHFFYQQTS